MADPPAGVNAYTATLLILQSSGQAIGQFAVARPGIKPPDAIPPTVPTEFSATAVSTSQINLSWKAAKDNVAIAGYRIYRNGEFLISVFGTSYSDKNLAQATIYTYTITAYDAADNMSAQSPGVSAKTFNSL